MKYSGSNVEQTLANLIAGGSMVEQGCRFCIHLDGGQPRLLVYAADNAVWAIAGEFGFYAPNLGDRSVGGILGDQVVSQMEAEFVLAGHGLENDTVQLRCRVDLHRP